ncbi:CDP-diacylglycerol--glycerol-3-phosphate 3-phosphatidyltransferase [Roseovarius sp. M141]|uniref:CDP-diacylglycerol--glycerol-3-phosphate 3-phosphatidyltransferase n=1 Tax=Roseovarius sp. M141 TaxID=2583806 RepID=UPI0020CF2FD6|nr:CDP-diacylglycerol--glycerol-3-phosphate 3-phosphatidyltransferase [Roseovarius sp. M141]MCQ0091917.1 CDP-diacylglycerol--glycerol-3-phosphate 3-phosphatidyltransferase [Roseovarius sp. M141]
MTWTVPNILTLLRLLAAPGVAVMFLYFTRPYADWFALILFVSAAVTDWFDGYLARSWKQETRLGAMLDPIADKAMVVIALMVIVGYSTMSPWLVLPATVILFREVFVSGLREFLGDTAGTLKVTKLAKWKTTAQMVAIATLFAQGVFEGLGWKLAGLHYTWYAGLWLLWLAAVLTLISGIDYLLKSLPYLKDDR